MFIVLVDGEVKDNFAVGALGKVEVIGVANQKPGL